MQSKWLLPTAFKLWGIEEQEAIQRVVASDWFTYGEEVKAFEAEYAAYHNRKYAVAVNSGSSANLVAIAALCTLGKNPLRRGDKVVVPAIAWATTYAPLVQHGLDLVVLDVDDSWNLDPSSHFDTKGIRLFVGCSILGNPAPLDWLQTTADSCGAYFFNDDCESLGARLGTATTGSFGLLATSSFFMSHQLSAIEGGAILTDDEECYRLCKMLRSHGWTRDTEIAKTFDDEYRFELFAYNTRPLELHAAIARAQLPKLKRFVTERYCNLSHFQKVSKHLPIKLPVLRTLDPSPFGLAFTVVSRETRARLVAGLRDAGIDCRLPTGGSFTKHLYGLPWREQWPTPNADRIHETGLFLGNAPFPIEDKIDRAVAVMEKVLLCEGA